MKRSSKIRLVLAGSGAVLVLAVLALLQLDRQYRSPLYEEYGQVEEGMTEDQVLALLGRPDRSYTRTTAPEDYYVEGYSFRRRTISHKVAIYIGGEPIAYVWYDEENRVEGVFVGGS